MMRTCSSQFFSYRASLALLYLLCITLCRIVRDGKPLVNAWRAEWKRATGPPFQGHFEIFGPSRGDATRRRGPAGTGSLDVVLRNLPLESRDTRGPYNSAPVFGSVWKAERAGKIKLFQKPGAFPSPRRIADRFSCVPLRSDTLSLTRGLPLSPALPISITVSLSFC